MTMLDGTQDRYAVFIYSYGYVTTVDAYQKEKREKAISHAVDIVAENLTGVKGLTNPSHPTDYEDVSKMLHKLLKDYIR